MNAKYRLHKLLYMNGSWKYCENQIEILTISSFFYKGCYVLKPKKLPLINLMSYRTSVYTFVEKYKNHKLVQNFLLTMYHEWLLHIELKGEFESNHQCQLPIHTIWRIFFLRGQQSSGFMIFRTTDGFFKIFKKKGISHSLNTQSCIKGPLVFRDFCFWAILAARPVLKFSSILLK